MRDLGTASAIVTMDMSRKSGLIGHAIAAVAETKRTIVRVYMSLTELLARVQMKLLQ
jgi:hypothetical protein